MAKNWEKIKNQSATDTLRNRDVYETQQLDRSKIGKKQSFTSRHIIAISVGVLCAFVVWALWSIYDISRLNNEAAAAANMAVVITEPAPDEPRDLADVTWANMIMVEDRTYASYGYTYADKRTGVKYTQAEYEIWLDVHRRINSGMCPEILKKANGDGTFTYKERDFIAPAPEKPRDFTHAEIINFIQRGIVEDNCYRDMGYYYRENYKGTYLTKAEYEVTRKYTHDYIQQLIDEKLVTFKEIETTNSDGAPKMVYMFYDVDNDVIEPIVPTEQAGSRYYTPIDLPDVEWANMQLVADNTAASLGYGYRDLRTGKFYTAVEYDKWSNIYNAAMLFSKDYRFWIDVSEEDGGYTFSLSPSDYAGDTPRERFSSYLIPTLLKMNLVKTEFWTDYGYPYYDYYTKMFYSEVEYQAWLETQNALVSGAIRVPKQTQNEIRSKNIKVSQVVADHLDPLPVTYSYSEAFVSVYFLKILASLGAGFVVYSLLKALLKKNLDAQNLMNDTSDINQYENDQHIALPEEVQRKFDWFPDVGAHCPVQVSSMISHMMITNKGLNKIKIAKRAEKDIVDEDGDIVFYKGEALIDDNGEVMTELVPLIDTKFADELYDASGAPKEVRKYYDTTKIPYNPEGKDRTKQCGTHKTVADAINKTWTFPLYEPQRPAGAYIVDTEPVNTMVLAITRAGKGQWFGPFTYLFRYQRGICLEFNI